MEDALVIARAPLRISLAGGGTDLPEYFTKPGRVGSFVSFAIDSYVWVTLSRRFEPEVVVSYREVEVASGVEEIKHDLVRKALLHYGLPKTHMEVHIIANLPGKGTGLGSSSALAVALVKACRRWNKETPITWKQQAELAFHLERSDGGPFVGLQDHIAASHGSAYAINLTGIESRSWNQERLHDDTITELLDRLALFHIQERQHSSAEIMEDMTLRLQSESEDNLRWLDMAEKQARAMANAVMCHNWERVGTLLHSAWMTKKGFSPLISTPNINALYDECMAAGAWGGKLCGAGGGGFLLVCAPPDRLDAIRRMMDNHGCTEMIIRQAETDSCHCQAIS